MRWEPTAGTRKSNTGILRVSFVSTSVTIEGEIRDFSKQIGFELTVSNLIGRSV